MSCSHAYYCSNDFQAAADAFQRGLDIDPSNNNLKTGLNSAKARIPKDTSASTAAAADTSSSSGQDPVGSSAGAGFGGMADMLRNMGMGGGGTGGGMPDLASMMNNPMMMQMAQQMMANGGLERLMQNPAIQNMVSGDRHPHQEKGSSPDSLLSFFR